MKENKNYTVEDVARVAKVSTATVSRVFNGSAKVNKDTTQKVLTAAEKLNYKPSRVARRLRIKSAQSLVIGLIITDLQNPFFSDIARGVEDIAYKNENGVIICNSDENLEKEQFYAETLIAEQVSGLIVAPSNGSNDYIQQISDRNIPVVCVDRRIASVDVDTVTVDNESGAYLATKRLIDLGHKRIGIINGIKGISTTEERFEGYKIAIEENGMALEPALVTYGKSKEEGGIACTRKLLALDHPPTAVFSTNNLMTLGFFEEMYRQNISIPDEMAVIGFDDMSWSSALNPPLTAVWQPGYELGSTAADLLLKRLVNPSRAVSDIVLKPELIVRKSCGHPIG